jgi:hypothetical protein
MAYKSQKQECCISCFKPMQYTCAGYVHMTNAQIVVGSNCPVIPAGTAFLLTVTCAKLYSESDNTLQQLLVLLLYCTCQGNTKHV